MFGDHEACILLMEAIQLTTWDVQNPVNSGMNYQPQQVQDFFHQQYQSKAGGFIPFFLAGSFTSNLTKDLRNPNRVGKKTQPEKPHGLVGLKPMHCSAILKRRKSLRLFFGWLRAVPVFFHPEENSLRIRHSSYLPGWRLFGISFFSE